MITFRNIQISKYEAKFLQEIEKLTKKEFFRIDRVEWDHEFCNNTEFIAENHHISGIRIHNCRLMILPKSISNLSSLRELYLFRNFLTTLPESIGNLSSLRKLWVNHNKLKTLPELISKLKFLEELDLYDNPLENLPLSFKILEDRYVRIIK